METTSSRASETQRNEEKWQWTDASPLAKGVCRWATAHCYPITDTYSEGGMALAPVVGDFVRVRARRWLVEDQRQAGQHLIALKLACIDDDAQGETAHIVWNAELDAERLGEEGWESVARSGTDDPAVFAAY